MFPNHMILFANIFQIRNYTVKYQFQCIICIFQKKMVNFRLVNRKRRKIIQMDRRWCFSRKSSFLNNQKDQNQDPSSISSTFQREISAKNTLFHLAETDTDATEDKTFYVNQWFKMQNKQIEKDTNNKCGSKTPKRFYGRPFLDRNNQLNYPQQNQKESNIPRLKQQLMILETTSLPTKIQEEKRNTTATQPKMRRKYEILLFEEMLNNQRRSIRVKNAALQKKVAKLSQNNAIQDAKSRKLLRMGSSSKQLRQQSKYAKQPSEYLQIWQQARRNRTLNNLLQ